MLDLNSEILYQFLASYLLPMVRVLGIFTSAPFFGNRYVPATVRVGLGIAISAIITPSLPVVSIDLVSWNGTLALIQQFLIGVSLGFCIRIIFTAVEFAGELTGMTMGFGFATFFDPQSQGHSSSISQFLSALLMLIFLGSDLHLLILEILSSSFKEIPLDHGGFKDLQYQSLANLGGNIFKYGVQLALPLITALLLINMTLGVLTRAAPQLNLFGIGFPLSLLGGFLMLYMMLPYWSDLFVHMLEQNTLKLGSILKYLP